MKEELLAGLKNAIERGFSLDSAVASFVNAGYSATEVQEAASIISSGATTLIQQNTSSLGRQENAKPLPELSPKSSAGLNKEKGSNTLIITLLAILFILAAGIVTMVLFKDQILSLLK